MNAPQDTKHLKNPHEAKTKGDKLRYQAYVGQRKRSGFKPTSVSNYRNGSFRSHNQQYKHLRKNLTLPQFESHDHKTHSYGHYTSLEMADSANERAGALNSRNLTSSQVEFSKVRDQASMDKYQQDFRSASKLDLNDRKRFDLIPSAHGRSKGNDGKLAPINSLRNKRRRNHRKQDLKTFVKNYASPREFAAISARESTEALLSKSRISKVHKEDSKALQKILKRIAKKNERSDCVFANYCPGAPHNTSQFLIQNFNLNQSSGLPSFPGSSLSDIQLLLDQSAGFELSHDPKGFGSGPPQRRDSDELSSCNAGAIVQNLIGSFSSGSTVAEKVDSNSNQPFGSIFEHVGTSMQGFATPDMFAELDDDSTDNPETPNSPPYKDSPSKIERGAPSQVDSGFPSPFKMEEFFMSHNLSNLQNNLMSGRHLCESLERELVSKNNLLEQLELQARKLSEVTVKGGKSLPYTETPRHNE